MKNPRSLRLGGKPPGKAMKGYGLQPWSAAGALLQKQQPPIPKESAEAM
jgi:hypothetical protein